VDEKLEQNIIQKSCYGVDKAILYVKDLQYQSYNSAATPRKPYININTLENYIPSSILIIKQPVLVLISIFLPGRYLNY
jgi:hypothetical protein